MIVPMIISCVAVFALLLLFVFARRTGAASCSIEEIAAHSMPVDLPAFRNLTDPAEEEYLRANLSASDFRHVQRARSRAALEYVWRTAHNAGLLLRVGQSARHNADAKVASAAEQLVSSALRLRVYSVFAICILYMRVIFPAARISASNFVDLYEQTRDRMSGLARFQVPVHASRLDSAM